jgi:hypothetical protein
MLPRRPIDFLTQPGAIAEATRLVKALSGLQFVFRANGRQETCPVQFSPLSSVVACSLDIAPPVAATGYTPTDPEVIVWRDRILAAGGSVNDASIQIAEALIDAIQAASLNDKIKYLLPLLGQDLIAARVPLRDTFGVGIAGSTGFTAGDFSEATGLQCNGTNKFFDTLINPFVRFTNGNMGYGYREGNYVAPAYHVMGWSPNVSEIYNMNMRSDEARVFFGTIEAHNAASVAPGNGDWYFNRAAHNDHRLYLDGALAHSNATSDGITVSVGSSANTFLLGKLAYAGSDFIGNALIQHMLMTDGTLTTPEAADLHTILDTYLFTPTGR